MSGAGGRLSKEAAGSIGRAFRLVRFLLEGKRLDRFVAAELLGVEHPAAARYLKEAAEVLELEITTGDRGQRVYRMAGRRRHRLHDRDVVALALGASLAPVFRGSTYEAGMRKLRDFLVEDASRPRANLNRKFGFVPRGGEIALPDKAGELDELIDALFNNESVELEYNRFDGSRERLVLRPLSLLVHEHQLYLIAFEQTPSDARPFRFSRISGAERTGISFPYPSQAQYDPERLFEDAFGVFLRGEGDVHTVEVRLAPRWETYVQGHRWHPHQTVIPSAKGPRVRFRVRICPELVAWIRGFGEEIDVLQPDALKTVLQDPAFRWGE